MKIKNILRIASLTLLTAVISACSFLDTEPAVIPDEGYYDSEKKLIYGLAGVYGVMTSEEFYGHYYSLLISNADDLCYYNNYNNASARPDAYNHSAGTEVIYGCWSKLYEGIKNANKYMEALETVQIDPSKLSQSLDLYKSEARFLRAYYHFLLAQAWGDVPLREKATLSPNPADVQLAATPQAELLKWCVEEIEASIPALSNSPEGMMPSRVSQATAHGIAARIYLFMAGESVKAIEGVSKQELYGLAADHAKTVITMGRYELNPSYQQVFINMIGDRYDTQYFESMWEADFLGDRTSASSWTNGRIGDLMGLKSQSSANNYSEWACNYSYGYYNGSYRLWQLYWTADRTTDEATNAQTITDTRQEWNLPPYNYTGSDKRKIAYTKDGQKVTEILTQPQSMYKTPYTYNNSFSLREIDGQDMSVDTPFDTKYIVYDPTLMAATRNAGKWRRETIYEKQATAKRLYTAINFPILRYSDVLLMYAEASNEFAGAPDALAKESLLKVRNRAGVKTDAAKMNDYTSFRALVRNERGRELAFEGLRKWDLIRWGLFVEQMHSAGTDTPTENKYKNLTVVTYASSIYASVTERHIYLPIPTKELAVNRALKQHPLW